MNESLMLLALGWLAGILSPAIIDAIRQRREATSGHAALKSELNEVTYRLALSAHNVSMHLGRTDREHLQWLQTAISCYRGKEPTENITKYITAQLSWSDSTLQDHIAAEAAKEGKALVLPKFFLPFTDARVPVWHSLPSNVRVELLAIQGDLRLLSDAVDLSRVYLNLTFTQLKPGDHARLIENIAGAYEQYGKRCRIAADRMRHIEVAL